MFSIRLKNPAPGYLNPKKQRTQQATGSPLAIVTTLWDESICNLFLFSVCQGAPWTCYQSQHSQLFAKCSPGIVATCKILMSLPTHVPVYDYQN